VYGSHPRQTLPARLLVAAVCAVTLLALLIALAAPAPASAAGGQFGAKAASAKAERAKHKAKKQRRAKARRQAQQRRQMQRQRAQRRAGRKARVSPSLRLGAKPAAEPVEEPASFDGTLDAGFEQGLANWNTAGVGETIPTVASDVVRSGGRSGHVTLTGNQHRSELILGGNGGGSTDGMIEFTEGQEYWYGFSFYIGEMTYGGPGAHNLIMQFKGDDSGSPNFGLQLWDYEGDDGEYEDNPRGLWSHGDSMDGDRFLAEVPEHTWHDVVIHFRASSSDAGFYEVFLTGQLIDSRSDVSMIVPGADFAYIKNGLYRNGDEIPGDSELWLDSARLGPTQASVLAG
jgi:Polysaccharide lyase